MMNRRNFSKTAIMAGLSVPAINLVAGTSPAVNDQGTEDVKKLPVREFDVIVAGGGTAGVVAAIASGRLGAKTALIESKGYAGGTVVEGELPFTVSLICGKLFPVSKSVRL